MAPRKKNAAIKTSGATSSKAAPLPDWVKGGGPKPPPSTGTNRDGTAQLFPKGSKTPLNMLYERIQKIPGWLKPEVDAYQRKDSYSCVVTIRKENKQDRSNPYTIRLEPKEPGARLTCASSLEAKHWGATYALFRLFNHMGLHRALPPGPREYWLQLEGVKAEAPASDDWKWAADPFEALAKRDAEREAREKERAAREAARKDPSRRPLSREWQRALEVRMAPALRELVEATIRARMSEVPVGDVNAVATRAAGMSLDAPTLERELAALGLRPGYIRRVVAWLQDARQRYVSAAALAQLQQAHPLLASVLMLPDKEAALEYIVLYTPEQDLPPKLRPTAAAESFVTSAASGGGQDALVDSWAMDKLARSAGFPRANVARAIAAVRESGVTDRAAREGAVLERLLSELLGADLFASEASDDTEVASRRADERALVEACLDAGAVRGVSEREQVGAADYEVHLGTYDGEDAYLRVVLHPLSRYLAGAAAPTVYVTSATLPAFLRLGLTRHALRCLRGECHREDIRDALEMRAGVIYLLCEELSERVPAFLHDPPALDEVMEHLVEAVPRAPSAAAVRRRTVRDAKAQSVRTAKPLERDAAVDAALMAAHERLCASLKYRESIGPVRESLPAYAARPMLLSALQQHRVALVAGETGCGKTTQVPQFLLDDAIARGCGSLCNMVVTQPRRVSAMGVAARVAAERGESLDAMPGDDAQVGYAIRGEHRAGRGCRLLFTTTGVLLRRLATGADPALRSVSHVIVDEVHERSTDSDFLLLLLREVLQRNPSLHVVLMSATISADTFTEYFGGAPCLTIPGRTYPVQEHYLEDLVRLTGYRLPPGVRAPESSDKLLALEGVPEDAVPTLRALAAGRTDYALLAQAVAYAVQRADKIDFTGALTCRAAILVFCPGVGEIRQAIDAIAALHLDGVVLLPLHANLAAGEQRRVFQPVAKHQRKVVVATNVAETSITIPEVAFVIDTGRVREAQYDAEASVTRLLETWASRAACKQRAGRAGRTMPGECFRLYSRGTAEHVQRAQSVPELQRTALEGVVVQVKAIVPHGDVRAFLEQAIDPPSLTALDAAHRRLVIAGAIGAEGGYRAPLTPLGRHLANLPLDVRQAKLLVLASLFGCMEPLLHVVAVHASRSMVLGSAMRDEDAARARGAYMVGNSDVLTDAHLLAAWLGMRHARRPGRELRTWCERHGLSIQALQDMDMTRATLLRQLEELGFVDRAYVNAWRTRGPQWPAAAAAHALDAHSGNTNLLRALLLAALWPGVARVDQPTAKFVESASGAVRKEAHARELHYFDERDGRVFLHPSSQLFHATQFKSNYVAWFAKSASGAAGVARTYLRDVTEVPLYALLLFGGPLFVDHDAGGITVATGTEPSGDAWVRMRASARIGVLCRQLRQLMDRTLEQGVEDPHALLHEQNQSVVNAMIALITQDGLS